MNTQTPPYLRIAADLREQITSGQLPPGWTLETINALAARYDVNRMTASRAIAQLANEGLVETRSGSGTRVRERKPIIRLSRNRLSRTERTAGRGAFLSDADAGNWQPDVTVTVSRRQVSEDVAAFLELDPDDSQEVVVRDRVMRADGEVVQLAVSHLPVSVAGGTQVEQADTGEGGTYARLEELGFELTHFTEMVATRPPQPEEADSLRVPHGFPVMQVTRVAFAEDTAVEVNVMVMSGERYQLVYQLDAD